MTLNLLALKRYEHWLNDHHGPASIAAFNRLKLTEQLAIAETWAGNADAKTDRSLQEDWSKG